MENDPADKEMIMGNEEYSVGVADSATSLEEHMKGIHEMFEIDPKRNLANLGAFTSCDLHLDGLQKSRTDSTERQITFAIDSAACMC